MSRASRARRIAAAAAYGGTGVTMVGAAGLAVLTAEAQLARRWIGSPLGAALPVDGVYGAGAGPVLDLAVLGDSSAAGLGADRPEQTPGAVLATGLAAVSGRPVRLTSVAVVGADSAALAEQVDALLDRVAAPHVAVVMVGANDVTHRVRPQVAVRALEAAVRRLRATGCEVVVGTCPDLGTLEPVAQPLRYLARRWSRQLAAAQTIAVVEAGARSVSLGDLLGPEFAASPGDMFSADRFHPSAAGYARAAAAVLPSVCASLGYWPDGGHERRPDVRQGEGVVPVAQAAVAAADEAGTEVAATRVAGSERGPRGRWAVLLRRRTASAGADAAGGAATDGAATDGRLRREGPPRRAAPRLRSRPARRRAVRSTATWRRRSPEVTPRSDRPAQAHQRLQRRGEGVLGLPWPDRLPRRQQRQQVGAGHLDLVAQGVHLQHRHRPGRAALQGGRRVRQALGRRVRPRGHRRSEPRQRDAAQPVRDPPDLHGEPLPGVARLGPRQVHCRRARPATELSRRPAGSRPAAASPGRARPA